MLRSIYEVTRHYQAFGMLMPGRTFNPTTHRFGFNGQEMVDEISGVGNHYTAEFWEYDPRSGRRWNVDPMAKPWQSCYSTFANNPILFVDPLGLYETKKEARQMKREAKAAGFEASKIYKVGDDYGFNTVDADNAIVGTFKRTDWGTKGADVQDATMAGNDPLFGNPLKRIEGTYQAESQITKFFLGTSDKKVYYEPTSGFSYLMKNSPGVKESLQNYVENQDLTKPFSFSPSTEGLNAFINSLPKSLSAHWDAFSNANLARLSMGGYTVIMTPTSDQNIFRVHLQNNMSMGSLMFHMKWAYDNPPQTGPLSTVQMKVDLGLFDISGLKK